MVNRADFFQYGLFLGIIISLPVLQVVVIGVWIYIKPSKEPADSQVGLVFVNESISL
jgi:hypothetical protein